MYKFFTNLLVITTLLSSKLILADNTLAVVNGIAIPQSRMDMILKEINQNEQGALIDEKLKARIKETLIANEVVRQEAIKKGLDKEPLYLAQVEQMKEQLLLRYFVNDFIKTHPITDAMARQAYEQMKAQENKEYKVRHILVENEIMAKSLIAQLKKGADFAALAKANSKDAGSAKQGGELGWAPANHYAPAFANSIRNMTKGKITDTPVKTEFGWHIIQLNDIRTISKVTFSEIKNEIIQQLQNAKLQKYIVECISNAKINS